MKIKYYKLTVHDFRIRHLDKAYATKEIAVKYALELLKNRSQGSRPIPSHHQYQYKQRKVDYIKNSTDVHMDIEWDKRRCETIEETEKIEIDNKIYLRNLKRVEYGEWERHPSERISVYITEHIFNLIDN